MHDCLRGHLHAVFAASLNVSIAAREHARARDDNNTTGTRPEKIRIQKWYTVYKDHITLGDCTCTTPTLSWMPIDDVQTS